MSSACGLFIFIGSFAFKFPTAEVTNLSRNYSIRFGTDNYVTKTEILPHNYN